MLASENQAAKIEELYTEAKAAGLQCTAEDFVNMAVCLSSAGRTAAVAALLGDMMDTVYTLSPELLEKMKVLFESWPGWQAAYTTVDSRYGQPCVCACMCHNRLVQWLRCPLGHVFAVYRA